eukprot:5544142-Pyramimonas_sp.AAC.1
MRQRLRGRTGPTRLHYCPLPTTGPTASKLPHGAWLAGSSCRARDADRLLSPSGVSATGAPPAITSCASASGPPSAATSLSESVISPSRSWNTLAQP